jgi:hypothetical protein
MIDNTSQDGAEAGKVVEVRYPVEVIIMPDRRSRG